MRDLPTLVVKNDKHEEKAERGGKQDEEIMSSPWTRGAPQSGDGTGFYGKDRNR